jgi:dihydrofolate synthase/folylpolyglutamate synthase
VTYTEALDYLFTQLPMYQRVGAVAFKKDLTNTISLCEHLGNPHLKFKSIHIAGTNGKGSVAHMLAAVYQATGLKVGLYSSPHLVDFRERIKINGKMISESEVVDFTTQMQPLIEGIRPSFFEITVAMAFQHFASHRVDLAVIETGLGGRLDSTNVVTPILSIITNISLEHQQFLGDTLGKIALEKAGIIKEGVPVIIGEKHPETEGIFRDVAKRRHSRIHFAQDEQRVSLLAQELDSIVVRTGSFGDLRVGCGGRYQVRNVPALLSAVDVLSKEVHVNLSPDPLALATFKQLTNFLGRWDVLLRSPVVIADGAHNVAGLTEVFTQLLELKPGRLRVVFGVVKDKDLEPILDTLPKAGAYYCCKPDLPRGLEAQALHNAMSSRGLLAVAADSVGAALQRALAEAHEDDLVFIGGSLFVVGEALAARALVS